MYRGIIIQLKAESSLETMEDRKQQKTCSKHRQTEIKTASSRSCKTILHKWRWNKHIPRYMKTERNYLSQTCPIRCTKEDSSGWKEMMLNTNSDL